MSDSSAWVQVAGALMVVAGVAAFSIPIASIVAGLFVVLFGVALEKGAS